MPKSRAAFKIMLTICALTWCTDILSCEGISITLSPLGMVSVCPGGQVVLTCETTSSSFLYWTVSFPHLAGAPERIVPDQGDITSPRFNIGFTEFNIIRTSQNPLITQLLIINVTTGINGSNIYCSVDGNKNNAPMVTINVTEYTDDSLEITLTNYFLRNSNLTVILEWSQEPGAAYNVDVLPAIPAKFTVAMSHSIITINLTITYDIQYTLTVVSSLCGITATKVLNYVTCDYRPTHLHGTVAVTMTTASGSDSPPTEGQFITYTCPPRYILTGPIASVCMGNGEWEPDPGDVECIADCGVPLVNRNVKLDYSSTLDGSVLILTCENEKSSINITDEQVLNVTCHNNASWIPDPAEFTCSSFTTLPPGTPLLTPVVPSGINVITMLSSIMITVCAVSSIVFLLIGYACGWFGHKRKQLHTISDLAKKNSHIEQSHDQLPQSSGPLYEELQPSMSTMTPEYQDLVKLKENVAYGPIVN